MNDFGEKLRQARERRGVSLRQIAASTKISAAALEALERNDVSKLPGGIFSKAFVRSYAIEVGLNPEETVREFLERFAEPVQTAASTPAAVPEEESAFESQQRMASVLLKIILASVALAGVILYLTLRDRPAAVPAQSLPPQDSPGAAPPDTAAAQGAPRAPEPPAAAPAVPAQVPAALTLELHPTAECWVSLMVDGRQILARLMQPGERQTQRVVESAVIQVGNAGAFAFSINGRPGRSLGEAGQVRTARITRQNMAEYLR